MPYIIKERRIAIADVGSAPASAGELTYALTRVVNDYLKHGQVNFGRLSEVLAALEATKLEFYRRVVAPYEDEAVKRNGDVY